MAKKTKTVDAIEGICPLLEIPCPRGEEVSLDCWLRFKSNFDPLSSFGDLGILECARARAERMRDATIKYLY